MMINNSMNMNKTNNHLLSKTIDHKKTKTCEVCDAISVLGSHVSCYRPNRFKLNIFSNAATRQGAVAHSAPCLVLPTILWVTKIWAYYGRYFWESLTIEWVFFLFFFYVALVFCEFFLFIYYYLLLFIIIYYYLFFYFIFFCFVLF
jgi:hypothetical protein